jgi:hypothetical protein
MTRETRNQNRAEAAVEHSSADAVMGFAVLGCLVAGIVGIFKASNMQSGIDVFLCLLGSVAAFGMVYYICFRRE